MAVKTKAVGIRLPTGLIERIEAYRQQHELNFTEALIELVGKGLGDDGAEIQVSDATLDERITILIAERLDATLDERIASSVRRLLGGQSDNCTDESVKQLSDAKLDKNIPSDDSSNSDRVSEDVANDTQADAIDSAVVDSPELGDEDLAGMTNKQMAESLGVSVDSVRRWASGKAKPSKDHADLFDRWEVRDSLWYQIKTNSGNN